MPEASAKRAQVQELRLEGVFDLAAAHRLERLMLQATCRLVIDLTHVRELHDTGMAALAHALRRGAAVPVSLRGLSQHQERLLRYLGVEPAAPLAAADG